MSEVYTNPPELDVAQETCISDTTAQLIALLRQRDAAGLAKYGTTLDRTDLTPEQWLQHMAEEMLDGAGYALAAMREIVRLRTELAEKDAIIQQLRAR